VGALTFAIPEDGLRLFIQSCLHQWQGQISQLCSDVQGHWRVCHEQLEDHSEAAGELRLNRLLIKCIIRVHQSDVDLDNVDAQEEEVEEYMET